ncbi:LysR family transcriptional regulator [Aestuariivita sp.]|jgi:DNA-binding transcriptional LysR family regulator|uniref:LysR family transcriptional regulator n=1 Tax=Aestuariivita sp. TaxID=1872407 RepID=UPI0025B7AEB4|nr:LysR family transcriptional regulator [Aestuariivita sp.]
MRLEWLDDILAIARTGSFSKAAEHRNLTQSAFSRRVQAIEDYVGIPLFDRARKPVQLRPTTLDQHDQIARLANDLRQLVVDLRRGDRVSGNRIVFASQHALTTSLTPHLLRWIGTRAPEAYVRLRSANQDECFALVLTRQADLALVYRASGQDQQIEGDFIERLVLGRERLIPVFSRAMSDTLNRSFQSGELPFIAYPGEVFLGQVMERSVLSAVRGMARATPKAETALTLAALELAAVGVGVAWVPSSLARARVEAGELVDLSTTLPSVNLDVTALRVSGRPNKMQAAIWDQLRSISETWPDAPPF